MPLTHQHRRRIMGARSPFLNGLVAYWPLDSVNDSGPNGLALTNNNSVTFVSGLGGRNCASFASASGQTLSRASSSTLTTPEAGDYTWSYWFNSTSNGSNNFLISKAAFDVVANRGFNWGLIHNAGSPQIVTNIYNTVPTVFAPANTSMSYGTWYHVAMQHIVSSKTIRRKINNGSWVSATYTGTYQTNTVQLLFTGNGNMQDVGFWGRQLTDDEIAQLYNGGVPVTYPTFR